MKTYFAFNYFIFHFFYNLGSTTEGPRGPPGKDGFTGLRGDSGLDGMPGKKGMSGMSGIPGTRGAQGETGAFGSPGGIGETGSFGAKGAVIFSIKPIFTSSRPRERSPGIGHKARQELG
jgi:hypothetical protein